MPPKNPELTHRNPSRLYANWRVWIEECRWCLFKALCLENEKNPTIRRLILGEEKQEEDDDERDFIQMMRDCSL